MGKISKLFKLEMERRYKKCPIAAFMYSDMEIKNISEYFAVFDSYIKANNPNEFWFRGHSKSTFSLTPSALRLETVQKRNKAINLIDDMKRFLELKLPAKPMPEDKIGWLQVAQHYGLPTRLLDWSQNAAVALYFACNNDLRSDGLVAVIDPNQLNTFARPDYSKIFNAQSDKELINEYLHLNGKIDNNGLPTVAINPAWNTERITLQQGAFTLHGNRSFSLSRNEVPSLFYLPILKEHKKNLLGQLSLIGISEMHIFPEPEHICNHLRKSI